MPYQQSRILAEKRKLRTYTRSVRIMTSTQDQLKDIWERARRASWNRCAAHHRGDFQAAARFAALKAELIVRVYRLAPTADFIVSVQWWRTNFLVCVTFAGSSLHLPYRCAPLFRLGTRDAQPRCPVHLPVARIQPYREDTVYRHPHATGFRPQWRKSDRI